MQIPEIFMSTCNSTKNVEVRQLFISLNINMSKNDSYYYIYFILINTGNDNIIPYAIIRNCL